MPIIKAHRDNVATGMKARRPRASSNGAPCPGGAGATHGLFTCTGISGGLSAETLDSFCQIGARIADDPFFIHKDAAGD